MLSSLFSGPFLFNSQNLSKFHLRSDRSMHLHSSRSRLLQQKVVQRMATIQSFLEEVREVLVNGDAPVKRWVAAVQRRERSDGAIHPRRPYHVRAAEGRHGNPRRVPALVRQNPVLHTPELAVANKLQCVRQREQVRLEGRSNDL